MIKYILDNIYFIQLQTGLHFHKSINLNKVIKFLYFMIIAVTLFLIGSEIKEGVDSMIKHLILTIITRNLCNSFDTLCGWVKCILLKDTPLI